LELDLKMCKMTISDIGWSSVLEFTGSEVCQYASCVWAWQCQSTSLYTQHSDSGI